MADALDRLVNIAHDFERAYEAAELRIASGPVVDRHRETAARLYGKRPEDVTATERYIGKMWNFVEHFSRPPHAMGARHFVQVWQDARRRRVIDDPWIDLGGEG